jgi:hypothetical protein
MKFDCVVVTLEESSGDGTVEREAGQICVGT